MDVADLIGRTNLPTLPSAAVQILDLFADTDVSTMDLAAAIELQRDLASRVVRLANCPLLGAAREIANVQQALVSLGIRTTRSLTLTALVMDSMEKHGRNTALADLWLRVLTNAMTGRTIAGLFDVDPDDAFFACLMQDLAMMVMARGLGEPYLDLFEEQKKEEAERLFVMEYKTFGIHHAEAGAQLCASWNMPHEVVSAIAEHEDADLETVLGRRRGLRDLFVVTEAVTEFLLWPTGRILHRFNLIADGFGESSVQLDCCLQSLDVRIKELAVTLGLTILDPSSLEQIASRAEAARNELVGRVQRADAPTSDPDFRALHVEDFKARLTRELDFAASQRVPLSVLMIQVGDRERSTPNNDLLTLFRDAIGDRIRDSDTLLRFRERVLCILAPNTSPQGCKKFAGYLMELLSDVLESRPGAEKPRLSCSYTTVKPQESHLAPQHIIDRAAADLHEPLASDL